MTPARYEETERSLNACARKVLDVVPIAEPWAIGSICSELVRIGKRTDYSVVLGCLGQLTQVGLVREVGKKTYQRVAPRPVLRSVSVPAVIVEEAVAMPVAPVAPVVESVPVLEKMAKLAQSMRDGARSLTALAESVEDLAVEVDEELKAREQDGAKLRQLQALLRGIGA